MKDWSDTGIMWVSGGIDHNGVVVGHPCYLLNQHGKEDCEPEHTAEEKYSTPWRWSVSDQMFMDHMIPPKRHMTEDEIFAVHDWLIEHGYADENSFPKEDS